MASVILDNARILTMDEALPTTAALAIAGGRVLGGVDSREDVIASHAHEHIDLQGATVVPGFVDAHVHFRSWALHRQRLQLQHSPDPEQLLVDIAAHADSLPADAWVLGGGWHDDAVRALTDPAGKLTAAASGRPAALVSKDGHALWCNEQALTTLALAEPDLEQPGGVVERVEGRLSGVLRETSAWTVRRLLPEDDLDTRALARAMQQANRRGVTAVHDMDGVVGFRSWRKLDQERGLSLRVWQNFLVQDLEHLSALQAGANFGSDRLRIGGLKVFADGTLGSGTAWLHEPELTSGQEPRGRREPVAITTQAELAALSTRAGQAGLSLLVHAIGDAAATAVIDALEQTAAHWQHLPHQPRIEHAQLMRQDDIKRCARLGIALSVQPTHLLTDRDTADARWGDRTERAYAYRSMLDAGANLLLGSDAPIEDLDPLAALRAAVRRTGDERAAWHSEQCLEPAQALRAMTSACADATGTAKEYGRLVPGKAADLVVLSGNPLDESLDEIEVVATMVAGRWVAGRSKLG